MLVFNFPRGQEVDSMGVGLFGASKLSPLLKYASVPACGKTHSVESGEPSLTVPTSAFHGEHRA